MTSISTLEILPDEMLLEICQYLLCVDVLLGFCNLNSRMTRMISDYRRHVSLHKASFVQSFILCTTILPQIGSHTHTLVIDNCYSALQAIAFPKYFASKMATIFPQLQKVILVSFRPDPLLVLLESLNNLKHLVTIDIRSLFRVPSEQQTTVLLALLRANNQRISSVFIDDQSSHLKPVMKAISNLIACPNITHLQIEITTRHEIALLLTIVPNVRRLYISIHDNDSPLYDEQLAEPFLSPPMQYLIDFRLKSVNRPWHLRDLVVLFAQLPVVQFLSLNLMTCDHELIDGARLLAVLSKSIREFNYAIHYVPNIPIVRSTLLYSWNSTRPVACLYDESQNDYMFVHTLPYSPFSYLEVSSSVAKSMPIYDTVRYENVQRVHVDNNWTLAEAFLIIGCCRRAKHAVIWVHGPNTTVSAEQQQQQQQQQVFSLPRLIRLRRLTMVGRTPTDLDRLSTILIAAPNLFRLDLNYGTLIPLLDNEQTRVLLQQRITALTINEMSSNASDTNEEYVTRIASTFTRLRHLYLDMKQFESTIDTMVLCFLTELFKFHAPLVSLCADGSPSTEMKSDAAKWLLAHCQFLTKDFAAFFNEKADRFLLWI